MCTVDGNSENEEDFFPSEVKGNVIESPQGLKTQLIGNGKILARLGEEEITIHLSGAGVDLHAAHNKSDVDMRAHKIALRVFDYQKEAEKEKNIDIFEGSSIDSSGASVRGKQAIKHLGHEQVPKEQWQAEHRCDCLFKEIISFSSDKLKEVNVGRKEDLYRMKSSEMSERFSIQAVFQESFFQGHPKYSILEKQFERLSKIYPEMRKARGGNDCTYLSFGIGYLKSISRNPGKVQELLDLANAYSYGGPISQFLRRYLNQGMDGDLELIAGNAEAMKDLVLILRKEIAKYIKESFILDQNGNYRVIGGRLSRENEKVMPHPRALAEFAQDAVPQEALLVGGRNLEERCRIISTQGQRSSEAMEYDALSRRFSCPFLDIVYQSGGHLRMRAEGDEYAISSYPLADNPRTYKLEDLEAGGLPRNDTFAVIAKSEGHSDVLFKLGA